MIFTQRAAYQKPVAGRRERQDLPAVIVICGSQFVSRVPWSPGDAAKINLDVMDLITAVNGENKT